MNQKRKRVEKKTIVDVVPKKRPEKKGAKKAITIEPEPEQPKIKKGKSEDKFIRIAEDSTSEQFKAIAEKVNAGELKLAYYAFDTNKGYHYYIVLPK